MYEIIGLLFAVTVILLHYRVRPDKEQRVSFLKISVPFLAVSAAVLFIVNGVAFLCGHWFDTANEFFIVNFLILPIVFGGLVLIARLGI